MWSLLDPLNPWLIASYLNLFSAILLASQALFHWPAPPQQRELDCSFRIGPVFKYCLFRFLACLTLLALAIISFKRDDDERSKRASLTLILLFSYVVFLASLCVLRHFRFCTSLGPANTHLNVQLLVLFGIYVYRDVWPLMKFHALPIDAHEGRILWCKIGLLAISSVVIPLITPRDSEDFKPEDQELTTDINPEQTASLFSLFTHSYLDAFIFRVYRKSKLTEDEIPPLANHDRSENVMKVLPEFDPLAGGKQRYLFWSYLKAFRTRILMFIGLQLLQITASFVAPIGINRLLKYIEQNGEGATIRPWVWILWLFLGPFLKAVISQLYTYIACRTTIQMSGILTQLLFEHALRTRLSWDSHTVNSQMKKDMVGRINNLAASDVAEMAGMSEFWIVVLCFPFQVALSIWFLYDILGWSAFAGLLVMLICIPVPRFIAKMMQTVQNVKKRKTDARVQSVTEALSILRMLKLFGWEKPLRLQVAKNREEELSYVKKRKILDLVNSHINLLIPLCTMIVTYATYTLLFRKELTASAVFSSFAVFEMFRVHLRQVVVSMPNIVAGKVAMDRVDEFLQNTDLLDCFDHDAPKKPTDDGNAVGFRDAEFYWGVGSDRLFKLRFGGDVFFRPRCINLILGPTGSGKTSLLLALLGEMKFRAINSESYYSLPRQGGVSYAAQESWVLNDTIKNNILFGSSFNEQRYSSVLYQCGLLQDLSLFEAGDQTEIGEKGLTLSGGQKARVTLARAVYSTADIVLLDDILAALDVHTANWIARKCLAGDLMRGRTVLLVTHNVALMKPLAQYAVHLNLDGNVTHGSLAEVLSVDRGLSAEMVKQIESLDDSSLGGDYVLGAIPINANKGGSSKIILAEEIEEGHVSWPSFRLYFSSLSAYPVLFCACFLGLIFLNEISFASQSWFLGYWSSQYETHPASEVQVPFFLLTYSSLILVSMGLYSAGFTVWTFGSIRAGKTIHSRFIESVLGTTFRWLDVTPASRVITRATVDMRIVDDALSLAFWQLSEITISMLVKLGAIVLFSPIFVIPALVIALLGGGFGQMYMTCQLPLRRIMSNAKSPIMGHFSAAMSGLVSIRAYGAQEAFLQESKQRIDKWFCPSIPFFNLNRWIAIRSETLAGIFTAGLGAYLVYGDGSISAANTGFSLTMAVGFTSLILTWVRVFNNTEVEANSLERIHGYLGIEQEDKATADGVPPAYWPSSGTIRAENLSARYSKSGPEVLHSISFNIMPGEHVGIVGRTGSGKSSLALALLRAIPTKGEIYYDDMQISTINLDALRSHITIIPQIPELLSGTLRRNLDPFEEYDDMTLNGALRSAGLYDAMSEENTKSLNLESEIASGGGNLSLGQRQIIALARAMIRQSKLLILDEATSSIDFKTDAVIQSTLRNKLKDTTLITVAHRLNTIMDYDRIMVLHEGRIVEFDSPSKLLQNAKGWFRALVDQSSDKADLYAKSGS